MCNMQSGTIECRGDGYLWDADCDGYDPNDHSMPCPQCNTKEYLLSVKEDAESTSYYYDWSGSGTGVDIWESGVKLAMFWNNEEVDKLLKEIGKVEAIFDADNEVGFDIKEFNYS
ncbi:hypothetical protein VPHG_00189 [Vibrio phage 11895-B1]|uniref:hypothetical protein n=1 Tax=Vibrio phage 11895-B1 TaxID=754075 RepID=UPI0002C12D89|nr:hypothetical protein VPHG_00189 [Vibrio phage 11895-B1]AGH32252.1 hypothetical protein VPHG_00189 [Vibrio phage 11895-B1]